MGAQRALRFARWAILVVLGDLGTDFIDHGRRTGRGMYSGCLLVSIQAIPSILECPLAHHGVATKNNPSEPDLAYQKKRVYIVNTMNIHCSHGIRCVIRAHWASLDCRWATRHPYWMYKPIPGPRRVTRPLDPAPLLAVWGGPGGTPPGLVYAGLRLRPLNVRNGKLRLLRIGALYQDFIRVHKIDEIGRFEDDTPILCDLL